ncbi:Uncharacterized protein HZ326_27799 [Fusarium oxysporum f. sp. albedinis]|nr:Uncharacterized protein HZ326_27799 [Fusarium oxysporum f. sp. albedinis]
MKVPKDRNPLSLFFTPFDLYRTDILGRGVLITQSSCAYWHSTHVPLADSLHACSKSGRNADLRDYYLYKLSFYRSYQLVYIDESGCDRRVGRRRIGWAPTGVTPVQLDRFHRDQRYQILPAYTQEGILHYDIFPGSTDSEKFDEFVEQLLHHCGKWPESNSVLVTDNASFHRSTVIEQTCTDAALLARLQSNRRVLC